MDICSGKHTKEDTHPTPRYLHATKAAKAGNYLIKTRVALPRQLRAEPRSLNDCIYCHTQASQVSMWPGYQSRSGVLKGTTDKLLKADERFANAMTY